MRLDFQNPFAGSGNIVSGSRFIGRKNGLQAIENRVIRPLEPGNLAIIGEPRVGKSSLAYKAIIERRKELIANRMLPIWINLPSYDQSAIFFRSLVTRCTDDLEDLDWLTEPIRRAADRAMQDELSWSEGYTRIERFFERVREAGIRVLFVLDEFDHARLLFKGDISGFQGLRELSYRPEWRVTFVVTSRRSIRDIELQTQAISTLDGIFHKHYLSMFEAEEVQEYFDRLASVGLPVTSTVKEKIDFYCGGHPYLLEMLGYELVEQYRVTQQTDVDRAARDVGQAFTDHYDRMIDLLREDGKLSKLLQILFGPIVDVKQTDVEELLRYGIIKPTPENTYTAFSDHFRSFLSLVERETELWPVWRETERRMRAVIASILEKSYGENWFDQLEKLHPKLGFDKETGKNLFQRCRELQQKEQQTWGSRASRNLLEFTYPQELFDIVFAEWTIFKTIFGKDKNYWSQRAALLARVRNPLAHNRDEAIYDYERQIAEGYCKEIIRMLESV